jgi:flavin reductase (DIM6/NTAB) family NADH-FMN oxidoreductase RutF
MKRNAIPFEKLLLKPHDLWKNQWMLLTSGDFHRKEFNAMTVAWGSLGMMWDKPFVQVVVRPTRHTFGFMERFDTFTLCAFTEKQRDAMSLMGSKSGRDCDKIAESGLTPMPSLNVQAPSFDEAELVFECRKIYSDDFDPGRFLDPRTFGLYPKRDFHRIYFGEVLAVFGAERFRA